MKEFFWTNIVFKEEPKSSQVFGAIEDHKDVVSIIMVADGNNPHNFIIKWLNKSRKSVLHD